MKCAATSPSPRLSRDCENGACGTDPSASLSFVLSSICTGLLEGLVLTMRLPAVALHEPSELMAQLVSAARTHELYERTAGRREP